MLREWLSSNPLNCCRGHMHHGSVCPSCCVNIIMSSQRDSANYEYTSCHGASECPLSLRVGGRSGLRVGGRGRGGRREKVGQGGRGSARILECRAEVEGGGPWERGQAFKADSLKFLLPRELRGSRRRT